jgi:type I restriction enzyme, S subunit
MNWKKVKLTDVCRPKQWKTLSMSDLDEVGYPVYGANGKIGFYKEYTHESETLLITCRGATCGTVNICEPKSYVNGNAMALDNLSKDYNLKFLFYFFIFRGFNDVISGSAQPQITGQGLSKIQIPLPDLATQKHIAEVLDKADALRQQNRQLLAHYDELLQSTFIELFGDPVKNPKGWEVRKLGEVAENIQIGPFGSLLHQEDYVTGSIPLINPTHISQMRIFPDNNLTVTLEKYQTLKNYHLKENDVIMGRRGEMARCALVTEKEQGWLCGTGSLFIRPSQSIVSKYLVYFFSNEKTKKVLESEAQGVTMANLNTKIIKNFPFPLPPLLLQQHFAKIVEQIEAQKAQAQAALTESEALFEGLLVGYFNA